MSSLSPRHSDSSSPRNDELVLFELLGALWQRKLMIIGIAIVVTLISVVYAYTATRYYKSQSILRAVSIKALDELNISDLYRITPEEALRRIGSGIDSYENRLEYFRQHQDLFGPESLNDGQTLEQGFSRINDELVTLRPDPKKSDGSFPYVGLAYTYPKGVQGAEIVNGLIDYVIQQERQSISEDVEVMVRNRLAKLEQRMAAERANYQAEKKTRIAALNEADALKRARLNDELQALRKQARGKRDNRIAQLSEAIQIAESLGIDKPSTPSALGESREIRAQGNVIRTEVNSQQNPLYFMGSEALKAERDALRNRKSDEFMEPRIAEIEMELRLLAQNREVELLKKRGDEDLFITNYAKWNKEAAELRGLNLNLSNLSLVNIDRHAVTPRSPIKPKPSMIVLIGGVLGLMLGTFIALFFVISKRYKSAL